MSYAISVYVEDGGVVGCDTSGDVPDGKYHINGHEDPAGRSFAATQYGPGDYPPVVAIASSYHKYPPQQAIPSAG